MTNRLRSFKDSSGRRKFLEESLEIELNNITSFSFTEEQVNGRNIENLVGATQIPLGVAGPVLIKREGESVKGKGYFIPLATTEGALVASVSRGCKAVSESGGVYVEVNNVGVTRAPVFKTSGIKHALQRA
jgi:hydroxymethylglutaryl-CoA reductase (NADPH)